MDTDGRFGGWRFSIYELIGFGASLASLAVGITLWATATFQSKSQALHDKATLEAQTKVMKENLERRVDTLETQMLQMRVNLERIGSDVSYIRGRMEPKGN